MTATVESYIAHEDMSVTVHYNFTRGHGRWGRGGARFEEPDGEAEVEILRVLDGNGADVSAHVTEKDRERITELITDRECES